MASVNLAVHAIIFAAIIKCVIDTDKIILIARWTAVPSSESNGLNGELFKEPVQYINLMNELFSNMITRKPGPVDPVSQHRLHITPSLLPVPVPEFSA